MKISSVLFDAIKAAINADNVKLSSVEFDPITLSIALGQFVSSVGLSESYSTSDELIFAFVKELTDSSLIAEQAVINFNKSISDESGVSEAALLEFAKSVSDSFGVIDYQALEFGKNAFDSGYLSESLVTSIDKYLSDNAFATDDLDGEATTLDDQEIFFHKVRNEAAFVTEVFERIVQYHREIDDNFGAIDSPALKLFRVVSDAVTVADNLDTRLIVPQDQSDSTGISETLSVIINKILNEQPVLAEAITVFYTKPLADNGLAQDLPQLLFSTARSDSSVVADNALKLYIKSLSDSGIMSDSGTYRGQGYCDFDYFLEDYVGYSGVF